MNHALLYVTEFEMPDGTTRAPLVKRCPECRPEPDGCYWTKLFHIDTLMLGFGGNGLGLPLSVVADVFRCAVEDWLMKHQEEQGGDLVFELGGRAIYGTGFGPVEGESIHHALVHAAHAVLDEEEQA